MTAVTIKPRFRTIALALTALLIHSAVLAGEQTAQGVARKVPGSSYSKVSHPEYDLYLPSRPEKGKKYPLLIALTPNASADWAWETWKDLAPRHKWIVYACKTSSNTSGPAKVKYFQINERVKEVCKKFPVDEKRIIASGFSGASVGSQTFCYRYPSTVAGVITNAGSIFPGFKNDPEFPRGKFAALMTSPTDHMYKYVLQDKAFLEKRGWDVLLQEYPGGHVLAPAAMYEKAAAWCDKQMEKRRSEAPQSAS